MLLKSVSHVSKLTVTYFLQNWSKKTVTIVRSSYQFPIIFPFQEINHILCCIVTLWVDGIRSLRRLYLLFVSLGIHILFVGVAGYCRIQVSSFWLESSQASLVSSISGFMLRKWMNGSSVNFEKKLSTLF